MSPVVLVVALVFGLVAAAYHGRALDQVRTRLAPQFQDPHSARHALDVLVWYRSMPSRARRDYVMSIAYSCVFIACIGILAYREGVKVVAIIFAGIVVIGAALTFMRWMRARVQS